MKFESCDQHTYYSSNKQFIVIIIYFCDRVSINLLIKYCSVIKIKIIKMKSFPKTLVKSESIIAAEEKSKQWPQYVAVLAGKFIIIIIVCCFT